MTPPPSRRRRLPSGRAVWLLIIIVVGFFLVLLRDILIQSVQAPALRLQGQERYLRDVPLPAERGVIFAAHHTPLAVNVAADTIWGDPHLLDKHPQDWQRIAQALGLSVPAFEQRLHNGGADFVYLRRQVSPRLGKAIARLNIDGLGVEDSSRSYYPLGPATTPLIGLVDQAHQGATGLELAYNQWLHPHAGLEEALIDGHGQVVKVPAVKALSHSGHALHLTIKPQLQYWAYLSLAASLKRFHAHSGSAVLINVRNGHVLAMVSVPSCNPNEKGACQNPLDYVNNAVHTAFEPGSVMKPFAIAAALASHSVAPNAKFNVFHPLWVGGYPITDDVPHHILSIEKILKYSSCIGTAKIALKTPRKTIYNMYRAVGFGRTPGLGLPGSTGGVLPSWTTWGKARHATIAIGYGVSVTTLQLAAAYATIANGGTYYRPTLIAGAANIHHRAMPRWVALDLRKWLRSVARPNGTGILAAIPGYAVAGKTGTANMANGQDGFYHHRTNATFVGFAPGRDPQLVMAVNLRGSSYAWNFGGIEAAPVFRFTMSRALRLEDIAPKCNTGHFLDIRVKPGQDLHEIAETWHSTSAYLQQINQLQSAADLQAGQLLKVPTPSDQKDFCRVQVPQVTRAQAEIWSEGGGN